MITREIVIARELAKLNRKICRLAKLQEFSMFAGTKKPAKDFGRRLQKIRLRMERRSHS